jgi:uncharacterized protein
MPAPLIAALALVTTVLVAIIWAAISGTPDTKGINVAITMALPPELPAAAEAPSSDEAAETLAPDDASKASADTATAVAPTATASAQPAPAAPQPTAPTPLLAPPQQQAQNPAPVAPAPVTPSPVSPASPATSQPTALPTGPESLTPAPAPGLTERGKDGPLPIIAADGRRARLVYARPFDTNNPRPRMAIVISDLGQSAAATEAAIQNLPGAVTLAFNPYGQRLDYWVARARAAGHEVLVLVPMEPVNYPANDPGPQTLLTTLSPAENRDKLNWSLSRFTGYVGVLSSAGSRYTTALESIRPTLEEINGRGLLFVDSRSSLRSSAFRIAGEIGLPRAINNRFIDVQASRDDIDQRLDEIAKLASNSGFAVGIGQPYPATIERVAAFVRTASDRGIAVAPMSALVDHQKE